ncbi:MAG: alpha-hydroxy-acid oxidizing protein, partial [Ottowia sp.]|nr:alpha-hydroxy-acid oxidizing protein [Ottowia sp.]
TAVQLTLSMIEDMNVVASLKYRAEQLGLEVVLAVHTPEELSRALAMQAVIIGINNRSIQHLEMDGGTVSLTEKLASMVPSNVLLLSESGLTLPNDVARAWVAGADAVLVGSAFAKSADVRLTLKDFLSAHLAPVV